MQRVLKKLYVICFVVVLFLPFILAHREENRVAEDENRYYANVPRLLNENGKFNTDYIQEFESWINDNARFRSLFREIKASALYKVFDYLDLENVRVGTNLELYDSDECDIELIQGRNLLSDVELSLYEDNLYRLQNWLENQSIDFYYMQCYDKTTVFEEGYPKGLVQYNTEHLGENTENYIVKKNRVNIVPLHETMEGAKEQNIYYKYLDSCHWNNAGMYLGYEKLMQKIGDKYPEIDYLTIDDYNIIQYNTYRDVYGFQYPIEEVFDVYEIKEKHAQEKETELYDRLYTKSWTYYFVNPDNKKKALVINDSFIGMDMKYHLAECFEECLTMELTNLSNISWIVDEYKPDIVILECVELNILRVKEMLESLECIE